MAKSKRASAWAQRSSRGALDVRQLGLHAFQSGRFAEAIRLWSPLAAQDEQVRAALAEAHFRSALAAHQQADKLAHLRHALALVPDDLRYQYHLGMALHRGGDLPAATTCYRTVLERDGWPNAALLLALATL